MKPWILAGALALAACGTTGTGVTLPPAPKTVDQTLYEIKTSLDVAVTQADVYAKLPRCGAGVPPVCSTAAIAGNLYSLAVKARDTIDAARALTKLAAGTVTPASVQAAVDAATTAVQQLAGAVAVVPKQGG